MVHHFFWTKNATEKFSYDYGENSKVEVINAV